MPEKEGPIEADIREAANELAATIDIALNPEGGRRIGFALLMFPLGDNQPGDRMTNIASADRQDMLAAMKEFIARNEGRHQEFNPDLKH